LVDCYWLLPASVAAFAFAAVVAVASRPKVRVEVSRANAYVGADASAL